MADLIVLGLVLTLVAGIVSLAVLILKTRSSPTRLPPSLRTSLILYNIWMAASLVYGYFQLFVFPELSTPGATWFAAAFLCVLQLVSLMWLRAHFTLIDDFLVSEVSRLAKRPVGWLVNAWAVLSIAGLALIFVNPAWDDVFFWSRQFVNVYLFPFALAGSGLLFLCARRRIEDPTRHAVAELAVSYAVLFSLLTALSIAGRYQVIARTVLLSTAVVLALGYNALTVAWVALFADRFRLSAADGPRSGV